MLGQHHILIGCAGVLALRAAAPESDGLLLEVAPALSGIGAADLAPLLAAAALGSLLPDVDHPRAMLNNFSPVLKLVLALPALVLSHRGITHSLLAWAALSFVALAWGTEWGLFYYAVSASLGYLLHLLADGLTTAGVPLLWPVHRGSLGFPPARRLRFATGSRSEYLLVGAMLGATLVLLTSV